MNPDPCLNEINNEDSEENFTGDMVDLFGMIRDTGVISVEIHPMDLDDDIGTEEVEDNVEEMEQIIESIEAQRTTANENVTRVSFTDKKKTDDIIARFNRNKSEQRVGKQSNRMNRSYSDKQLCCNICIGIDTSFTQE